MLPQLQLQPQPLPLQLQPLPLQVPLLPDAQLPQQLPAETLQGQLDLKLAPPVPQTQPIVELQPIASLPIPQPQLLPQVALPQAPLQPGAFPQTAFLPQAQPLDAATQQLMAMQQAQMAQQAALQQAQQVAYQQQLAATAYYQQLAATAAYTQQLAAPTAAAALSLGPMPAEIPGVTDTRFESKVAMVHRGRDFGFISCPPEIYEAIGRKDLFVHKQDILTLEVGQAVSFGVKLHKDGRPQARDIVLSTAPAASATAAAGLDALPAGPVAGPDPGPLAARTSGDEPGEAPASQS
jgi:cold shock CspA family protein